MKVIYPVVFMKDIEAVLQIASKIIHSFPKSKNKQPYLTLKNGRKMFFNIFIQKYGLNQQECKYKPRDIIRRIRLIEFFDYFVKYYNSKYGGLNKNKKRQYFIESNFYRMIIIDIGVENRSKFELLSFYPKV